MFAERIILKKALYWSSLLLVVALLIMLPQLRLDRGNSVFFLQESFEAMTDDQTTLYSFLIPMEESVIQMLFIILAIALLVLVLAHISYDQEQPGTAFVTGIIMALTPTFLALHLNPTLGPLLVVLVLLTTYLYRIHSRFYLLSFGLLFVLDPISGLLLSLFIAVHLYTEKDMRGMIFLLVATGLLLGTYMVAPLSFPTLNLLVQMDDLFTFFGSYMGYTLSLLILGFGGIAYDFNQKKDAFLSTFAILVIIIGAIYVPLRLLSIIVLAYYSAKALTGLTTYNYANKQLGTVIILLFICMFLFSTVTFIKTALVEKPNSLQLEAYDWLAQKGNETILVHPNSRAQIDYYTSLKTYETSLDLLKNRNFEELKTLLQQNNISYILVDDPIEKSIEREDDGLLFLLQNNDQFTIEYQHVLTVYGVNFS